MESLKEFPPAKGSSLSLGAIPDKIQSATTGQQELTITAAASKEVAIISSFGEDS